MTACVGYDHRSGYKCDRLAVRTVTAGCKHEHVGPREFCDWHVDDVRAGHMLCGDCAKSVIPHECKLHALAEAAL